jgi:molybdopterin molybdotransferase
VAGLLSRTDALALILERVRPVGVENVSLPEAAGRVLAEPAVSAVDLPPFPSSAMDGFAVRSGDTPGTLSVTERVAAGKPSVQQLAPGRAMAVATGAAVPVGADAVVPIERVHDRGDAVEVPERVRSGENVREQGGDTRAGEEVLPARTLVGPAQVGALAAAGVTELVCSRRPRAALLTTGTELRSPGEPLEFGQIYESNGVMLDALLRSAGADVERLGSVGDDPGEHREAISQGLTADLLVTSGGVSVGPHDLVRATERELGVEEIFWGVAVRPGKPLAFGLRGRTLVFGLPGNPVSALVSAELFVRPAVLALQGAASPGPHFERGTLGVAVRPNRSRDDLLRVRAEFADPVRLFPVSGQESHMIVRGAAANALALIPQGEDELPAGADVRYLRLA